LSSLLQSAEEYVVLGQKPNLIAPVGWVFSPIALPETPLEPSCINVVPRNQSLGKLPSLSKEAVEMLSKFYLTWLAFFGALEITGFSNGEIMLYFCVMNVIP
jgi:hypothetical protein